MKRAITLLMAVVMVIGAAALCVSAEDYVYQPQAEGNYVVGANANKEKGTLYSALCEALPRTIVEVTKWNSGNTLTPSDTKIFIATGDKIRINGKNYTLVVKGDVTGDGLVNAEDYLLVKRFYIGTADFTGENKPDANACKYAAGDTDLDGEIKAVEYLKIKRHVLGSYDLNKEYLVPVSELGDDESGWTSSWV